MLNLHYSFFPFYIDQIMLITSLLAGCYSDYKNSNNDNLHQLAPKRKQLIICTTFRTSRSQMLFTISVLKNFAIFTEKHMCWNLFLIKLQSSRPATLLRKHSDKGVFLWILQNFVIDHLRCLVLIILLHSYILTESLFHSAARFRTALRTLLRINDGVSLRI